MDSLAAASSRWIEKAFTAWSEGDHETASLLAPISLELLGKAVLWRRNPALLLSFKHSPEASLAILASTNPDLSNPDLRTIGLSDVLSRLRKDLEPSRVPKSRQDRVVATRNGLVHVGTSRGATDLIVDVAALTNPLLALLSTSSERHFGVHDRTVRELVTARHSEVAQSVLAKQSRARQYLSRLRDQLGDEALELAAASLEAQAASEALLPSSAFSPVSVKQDCPECRNEGYFIGLIDIEVEPDYDQEPDGEGGYDLFISGHNKYALFSPEQFTCSVCKLHLSGRDELSASTLGGGSFHLDSWNFDGFDLDEWIETLD